MSEPLAISEIFSSIQGEGFLAGRRQIFIRLTGCNLACRYCDTEHAATETGRVENQPGSNVFDRLEQPVALSQLLDILMDWCIALPGAHHSVSLTGGEPLLCADILAGWLPMMREILPVHLETNGTLVAGLDRIIEHVDYISMDMKLPSTARSDEDLWELHRRFLEKARSKNVSVKIVVGESTVAEEIYRVCGIIDRVRPETVLFIQPVTLPDKSCGITSPHLLHLQSLAATLLPDVRVIPQMHLLMGVP